MMRPPRSSRLVSRFAVASLVAFTAIGVAVAFLVSDQLRTRQEEAAKYHAVFAINSILRYELTAGDVATPVDPQSPRYRTLSDLVRTRLLIAPVVRVKVWRPDGTIIFSDEPRLVGRHFPEEGEELAEVFDGEVSAGVSDLRAEENVLERGRFSKLFETHVPLYLDPDTTGRADAVAEIYTDYAGIQNEVDRLFRTLLATLGAGLLALYLVLLPIIRRASRTLSEQNAQLEAQAERLQELLEGEQETVSDLRELNRLKDEFVAMASHEVRTPLTSIIGYAKTLRRPEFAHDAEARREFLDGIERQGTRLLRLVENLLTASRIEDVRGRPAIAPVSIPDVVAESVGALGSRSNRVLVSLSPDLPVVKTDERILDLILANLLDNALKFSPEDAACEVGSRRTPESVQVWVTDHGIGIDPREVDRIFDRFYQVDSSVTRRFGGVGLGLHLVRELVQSLGGTVTVDSAPGSGSTFVVTLPLAPPGDGSASEDAGPLVQTAHR